MAFHWSFRFANSFLNPLNSGMSSNLHISSHDFAGSHSVGFLFGLSNPTPPVRKKRKSSMLISSRCMSKLQHRMKEKSNLSSKGSRIFKIKLKKSQIDSDENTVIFFFFRFGFGLLFAVTKTGYPRAVLSKV